MDRKDKILEPHGKGTLPQTSKKVNTFLPVLVLATVFSVLAFFGSGPRKSAPKESKARLTVIKAFDSSKSNQAALPLDMAETSDLLSELPDGTFVTAYRIDSTCEEVFNGAAPEFTEDFVERLVRRLQYPSEVDNTYLNLLGDEITRRLKAATGKVVVIISSDYYGEGMFEPEHRHLAAEVAQWDRNPHVVGIFVTGVNPKNMAAARKDFAGAGNKLTVTPDGIDADAVNALLNPEAAK